MAFGAYVLLCLGIIVIIGLLMIAGFILYALHSL